jgi:TolA-binding protein
MTNKLLLATLLVILLLSAPTLAPAQKREDFLAIQREVSQLEDQMKTFQKSQDEKMAALTALVQQSLDTETKLSSGLVALQKNLEGSLAEQQSKLVVPMATLGTKVDNQGDELRGAKENIAALSSQIAKLDAKLTDVLTAIRVMNAPPTAPAPPPAAQISAEQLWENANRDLASGKDSLAMQELVDYVNKFHDTEFAPTAQFNIGVIYDRADQNEDALKAFDAVLQFAPNPNSGNAMYWKAMEQMKLDKNAEAIATFKEFLKLYPTNENAAKARANLKDLGVGGPAKPPVHRNTKKQ